MASEMLDEKAIFNVARQIGSPDARAEYLQQACGTDSGLRERVQVLLRAYEEQASFLESPPPVGGIPTIDQPASESPGAVIGPYKLVEQIGEGGMGTVWKAQQTEPVKRLVALKLIKAGMDSRQVVARFEAERQALALMDHPNIARVLDAGTTGAGRPYFVMDLVKGVPITRYCDEHRLTPRQRLELFLPVCQAVQHAHQKGIIHRDLKPSNVLVALYDGKPVPKVIDFGVAKATGQSLTEKTLVTGFGAIVGTLEYMSPEQAEINQLDIDTRSDVYSLGVLLYELLTGSPPFTRKELEKAGVLEMLRVIREQEPPKPSAKLSTAEGLPTLAANRGTEPAKLMKLVRGELDWIVMKALEKDRNRRYETANGFAADVQRYLADEPVQACPPSPWYRLRKFARRNRRALATAAVLGIMVLVTLGAVAANVGWMLHERNERQRRATHEIERAVQEGNRLLALRRWPDAWAYAEHAEDVLNHEDGQESLRPIVAELLRDLRMLGGLEEVGLRKSRAFVVGSRADSQQVGFANPAAEYGPIFREYGLDPLELATADAARRIRMSSIADYLVEALSDWAQMEPDRATRERLTALVRATNPEGILARWREALDKGDKEKMRQLIAGLRIGAVAPDTLAFLGRSSFTQGLTRESLALFRAAHLHYPESFELNSDLAYACMKLEPPQLEEAARHYTAALALRPKNAFVCLNLGVVLTNQGKRDAALTMYSKALELKPDLAFAHNNVGLLLKYQGKIEEAEAALRHAIKLLPDQAIFHNNLARLLCEDPARRQEALACFGKALELDPHYANAHSGLGILLDNRDKAVAAFRRAIECDPAFAEAHLNLGLRYLDWGKAEAARGLTASARDKFDKAAAEFQDAVTLYQAALRKARDGDPASAAAHHELGMAYGGWGEAEAARGSAASAGEKFDQAIARFQDAVALDRNYANAWYALGVAARGRGRMKTAIDAFEKATALSPKDARAPTNLGNMYLRLGQSPRAVEAYRKALAADPDSIRTHLNMCAALFEQGQFGEAEKVVVACLPRKKDEPKIVLNLAAVFDQQGRWADAVALLEREKEQLPEGDRYRKEYESDLALYRQRVELEGNLPAILSGEKEPKSVAQRLAAAELCLKKKQYAAAVQLYQEAFSEQPAVADNLGKAYRFDAARAAACAAGGLDQGRPPAAAAQRARWREQALAWLRADLTLWGRRAQQVDPQVYPVIIRALAGWRHHVHLAGVSGAALGNLSPAEREAWGKLWADVDSLLQGLPVP
jgi:serine/threonine protein kinase/Flp pilus assembly protein TadD